MADDLLDLTLELCNKDAAHNPRFPARLYDSYVTRTVNTALDVLEYIVLANEDREGSLPDRRRLQSRAEAKCVLLNHLIRSALRHRWISDKQHDRWAGLTTALRWAVYNWWKATK